MKRRVRYSFLLLILSIFFVGCGKDISISNLDDVDIKQISDMDDAANVSDVDIAPNENKIYSANEIYEQFLGVSSTGERVKAIVDDNVDRISDYDLFTDTESKYCGRTFYLEDLVSELQSLKEEDENYNYTPISIQYYFYNELLIIKYTGLGMSEDECLYHILKYKSDGLYIVSSLIDHASAGTTWYTLYDNGYINIFEHVGTGVSCDKYGFINMDGNIETVYATEILVPSQLPENFYDIYLEIYPDEYMHPFFGSEYSNIVWYGCTDVYSAGTHNNDDLDVLIEIDKLYYELINDTSELTEYDIQFINYISETAYYISPEEMDDHIDSQWDIYMKDHIKDPQEINWTSLN